MHRSRCGGEPTAEDRHEYRLVAAGDEVVLGLHFDATLQDIAAFLEARLTPADPCPALQRPRCAAGPSGSALR